jgi:hypothetical protein
MKVKLLKKLREQGRNKVHILSTTAEKRCFSDGWINVGMSYSFNEPEYSDLFFLGDTEEDVKDRAMRIFFKTNIDLIRDAYKKYTRKYKKAMKVGEE